eukprot:TRINITY_DN591_c1_g1_i1.p1 TRINITY_DN591_c1_g1~~TRINITY_DN591_c1_g1_i1.p1  ORF type:complete len:611 (-),score=173.87 TRINITY_DN591_c1_g1_i1:13-1845(-)
MATTGERRKRRKFPKLYTAVELNTFTLDGNEDVVGLKELAEDRFHVKNVTTLNKADLISQIVKERRKQEKEKDKSDKKDDKKKKKKQKKEPSSSGGGSKSDKSKTDNNHKAKHDEKKSNGGIGNSGKFPFAISPKDKRKYPSGSTTLELKSCTLQGKDGAIGLRELASLCGVTSITTLSKPKLIEAIQEQCKSHQPSSSSSSPSSSSSTPSSSPSPPSSSSSSSSSPSSSSSSSSSHPTSKPTVPLRKRVVAPLPSSIPDHLTVGSFNIRLLGKNRIESNPRRADVIARVISRFHVCAIQEVMPPSRNPTSDKVHEDVIYVMEEILSRLNTPQSGGGAHIKWAYIVSKLSHASPASAHGGAGHAREHSACFYRSDILKCRSHSLMQIKTKAAKHPVDVFVRSPYIMSFVPASSSSASKSLVSPAFVFISVHIAAPGKPSRETEIKNLSRVIQQMRDRWLVDKKGGVDEVPVILAGDFNTAPCEKEFHKMKQHPSAGQRKGGATEGSPLYYMHVIADGQPTTMSEDKTYDNIWLPCHHVRPLSQGVLFEFCQWQRDLKEPASSHNGKRELRSQVVDNSTNPVSDHYPIFATLESSSLGGRGMSVDEFVFHD